MNVNVSFQRSVQELTELLHKMQTLGANLDATEAKSTHVSSRLVQGFQQIVAEIQHVTTAYEAANKATGNADREAQSMAQVAQRAAGMLETLAQSHARSSVSAAALKGELGGLKNIIEETAKLNSFIRWTERMASVAEDLAGKEEYLETVLNHSRTTMFQNAAATRQRITTAEQLAAAEAKLSGQLQLTLESQRLLSTTDGQALAIAREKLRNQEQLTAAEEKMVGQISLTERALQMLSSTDGQYLETLKARLRAERQQAAEGERRIATLQSLQSALQYLQSDEGKRESLLRQQVAEQRRANEEEAKASLGIDAHSRAVQRLTADQAKLIAQQRELEATTRAANEAQIRSSLGSQPGGRPYKRSLDQTLDMATSDASNASLRAQLARNATFGQQSASLSLTSVSAGQNEAKERALAEAIRIRNELTRATAETQHRLTAEQAATIVKTEQLTAATDRANRATLETARNNAGTSSAQQSLNRSLDEQVTKLNELRERKKSLEGVDGAQYRSLQRQIAEEQRQVSALEGTTNAFGRAGRAARKYGLDLDTSAQAGAAFRAMLAGAKASFGSFAGSTLLVASSFFSVSAAMRSTIKDGMDYEKSMSRIQALTTTAGESSQETAVRMGRVQSAVRQQAIDSIYNAKETAEGFQYLVQSGMDANTAIQSLPATLSMASVSMLSMKEAADLTTNILTGFNLPAKELATTVDQMALAVTKSNSTMMELGNALSYVGPSAASAGYDIKEVTAAVMVLSNNGIKGSRAGTGLRSIFTGLIEPSREGQKIMQDMGIAVDDITGKTRPLTEVMAQLNDRMNALNMSDTERLAVINKLFGRYAQSAASVLIGQNKEVEKAKQLLDSATGAAQRMADTIRDNLSGAWENTTSAMDDVKLEVFERLAPFLTTATLQLNNFFLSLSNADVDRYIAKIADLGSTIKTMGTAFLYVKGFQYLTGGISSLATGMTNFARNTRIARADFNRLMTDFPAKYAQAKASMASANIASTGLWSGMRQNVLAANSAVKVLTGGVGILRGALIGMQAAAGWLGTILAVGTAVYSIYSLWASNGKKETQEFENSLDRAIEKQNTLRKVGDQMETTRKIEDLHKRIAEGEEKVAELNKQYVSMDELMASGRGSEAMKTAMGQVAEQINTVGGAIHILRQELSGLIQDGDKTTVDSMSVAQISAELQAKRHSYGEAMQRLYKTDTQEEAIKLAEANGAVGSKDRRDIDALEKRLAAKTAELASNRKVDANGRPIDDLDDWRKRLADATNTARNDAYNPKTVQQQIKENNEKIAKLQSDTEKSPPSKLSEERYKEQMGALQKRGAELEDQQRAQDARLDASWRTAYKHDQSVRQLIAQRATIDGKIAAELKKPALEQNKDVIAALYNDRSNVNSQIDSKNKEGAKQAKKGADELKKAADTYQKMVESLDDGTFKATRVFEERLRAINVLFKKGTVANTAATFEARKAFDRDLNKSNPYYRDSKTLVNNFTGKSDRIQSDYDARELQFQYDAMAGQDYKGDTGREAQRDLTKAALATARQRQHSALIDGLTPKSTSADLGTFQAAYSGFEEKYALDNKYRNRQIDLDVDKKSELSQNSVDEAKSITSDMTDEERAAKHKEFYDKRLEIEQQYAEKGAELERQRTETSKVASLQIAASVASSASTTLAGLSKLAKEGSTTQKAMLVASRAFHYAQMAMSTEAAATEVMTQGYIAASVAGARYGGPPDQAILSTYQTLATMTRVMGYANLAMTAVSDAADSSSSNSSSSSSSSTTETKKNVTFSGFRDKGGPIGNDEWAIVGEYGPEIVHGPANVISRQDTANAARAAMSGGGGNQINLNISPQVTVHSDGSSGDAEKQGKYTADIIANVVREVIVSELGHGGLLDRE